MHKIVIAVTGASGSIYTKVLLGKLRMMRDQVSDLAIVIITNSQSQL